MLKILTLIGIFYCPIFTLGCVLVHYEHPILGIIAIVFSVIIGNSNNKKKNKNNNNNKNDDDEYYPYEDVID